MLDRVAEGELPPKPHLAFRSKTGALFHEECLTRAGFDGPFTILYHRDRPHALVASPARHASRGARDRSEEDGGLRRRHYRTESTPSRVRRSMRACLSSSTMTSPSAW
jgi:homogentisate 1,2-dioxygenase